MLNAVVPWRLKDESVGLVLYIVPTIKVVVHAHNDKDFTFNIPEANQSTQTQT